MKRKIKRCSKRKTRTVANQFLWRPTFRLDISSVVLLDRLVDAFKIDGEESLFPKQLCLMIVEERNVTVIDAYVKIFTMLRESQHFLLGVSIVAREEHAFDYFARSGLGSFLGGSFLSHGPLELDLKKYADAVSIYENILTTIGKHLLTDPALTRTSIGYMLASLTRNFLTRNPLLRCAA